MFFTRTDQQGNDEDGDRGADPAGADARARTPRWTRFVATGDSFTEGLWDVPDGAPPARTTHVDPSLVCRGWADLLALRLAARRGAGAVVPLEYANLAIRGRLLGPIVNEQLPAALAMRPDLVSLVGGGNDLLRPTGDPDALAVLLDGAVAQIRATGADVLLATGVDTKESPLVRRTRARTAVLNAHVWSIASRHGAHVVDLWGMRSLRDWRMWAPDRIHLTTEGHRRVAQAALVALGLAPDDVAWDDPLTPLPPLPRTQRLRGDALWVRDHAYPWATRRLTRRSTGDARRPKRPVATPVEPADLVDPA